MPSCIYTQHTREKPTTNATNKMVDRIAARRLLHDSGNLIHGLVHGGFKRLLKVLKLVLSQQPKGALSVRNIGHALWINSLPSFVQFCVFFCVFFAGLI